MDIDIDNDIINKGISHLKKEHEWNLTPYGIIFNVNMSNYSYHCAYGSSNSGKFTDTDKWHDFTLNSGSLYIYMLNDTNTAMDYYSIVLNNYANNYNDQWDYRILSHYYGYDKPPLIGIDLPGYDMPGSPHILNNSDYNLCWEMCNNTQNCVAWTYQPPNTYSGCNSYPNTKPQCWLKDSIPAESPNKCVISGANTNDILSPSRPACTSHYDRQLIGYSLLLALNGQHYDRRYNNNKLTLKPKVKFNNINDCIPVFLPSSSFIICIKSIKCYNIDVLFGDLHLNTLIINDINIPLTNNHLKLSEHQ